MNVIAAIAVALEEAATPAFREYAAQTIHNAQTLADELIQRGYKVVTNGTDNHMIILDFTDKIYG
jgi:glycine hydroxymethyltransferase